METAQVRDDARWRLFAGQVGVLALVFGWLAWVWGSFAAFGAGFDAACPILFCDFERHFQPAAEAIVTTGRAAPGYFYPPTLALLLAPLRHLPLPTAELVWGAVELVCCGALCLLPPHLLRSCPRWLALLYTGLAASSVPVLQTFKWGQIGALMLLLALLAFVADARRRPLLAAALLALSIGLKLHPAVFVLPFLAQGRWRFVLLVGACTAAILGLLPALVLGVDGALGFYRDAMAQMDSVRDVWHGSPGSQFFASVVARNVAGTGPGFETARAVLVPVSYCIATLGAAGAALAVRRGIAHAAGWAFCVLACCLPFLVETSWLNYFVHVPVVQGFLCLLLPALPLRRATRALLLCLLVAPSIVLGNVLFHDLAAGGDAGRYAAAGWLGHANTLLLLALLVGLGAQLRRGGRVPDPTRGPDPRRGAPLR